MTLAEIKTQLTELYLADGYTFDETHEMLEEGVITWKGCKGKITHTNGKVDSFKITEVVSWSEANEYKDPFLDATEWLTEEFVCAPEVKANNHKSLVSWNGTIEEALITEFIRKPKTSNVWVEDSINIIHPITKKLTSHMVFCADQTPESYSHQVFIDYTNENTNRAC